MDVNDIIGRVQAAAGDKEQLALATLDLVLSVHGEELREVVEAAAIPHWFTAPILSHMLRLDSAQAEDFVERLSRLPMVEAFPARAGWNVHEATRRALRHDLARRQPERFLALSQQAASCFPGGDAHQKVESLYHNLIGLPATGASGLRYLHDAWLNAGKLENIQALEHALSELVKHESLTGLAAARCKTYLASLAEGYLTVAEVEKLAREALQVIASEPDELTEMDARDILGDSLKEQSRYGEALEEYRRCQQIANRLALADPGELKWQRELSVAYNKIGSIYQAQGLLDKALVEYQIYKGILLKLTVQNPDEEMWQRELALAFGYVGDLYASQNKLDQALTEHESYNAHLRKLVARDPENTRWQNDLASSCRSTGSVKQRLGRYEEALADFTSFRDIIQRLCLRDPENARLQADLGYAHWWIAGTLDVQGKRAQARKEALQASELLRKVNAADPGNQQWQKNLEDLLAFLATLESPAADA